MRECITKHRKAVIAIGLIMLTGIAFIAGQYQLKGRQVILKMLLYRMGNEHYLFELTRNGMLKVTFGDLADFDDPNSFVQIRETGSVTITTQQFSELDQMMEAIKKDVKPGYIPSMIGRTGGWDVSICMGENVTSMKKDTYRFQLGISEDERMEKIVSKLMEYAPIEMPFDHQSILNVKDEAIKQLLELK